jgi:F-type H+-transporting ATPase subunit delta
MTTQGSKVASQYANALLQLSSEAGTDKKVFDDLRLISQVLKANPEFTVVMRHPAVKPAEKKQLMISTFSGKVQELTLRILEMLCDRRRLEVMHDLESEYEKLWRKRQNILTGTLFYAEKPDSRVMTDITNRLEKQFGKTVELTEQEDKSLIGGYLLRVGDQIIDGSLKGRLQSIEKQLLSV